MKVIMTTQPGLGHFKPLTPLAWALERAGHQVTFVCSKSFVPQIEAVGLRAIPAGLDWLESRAEDTFPEMLAMSQEERATLLTEIFMDTASNHLTHDLLNLGWKPDLFVRESSEFAGCLAAECLGVPHAVLSTEFYMPNYLTRMILEEPLAYLRSAYGLPPHLAMEMVDRYLYLSVFPPSYQFPEYKLPPVAHVIRPMHIMSPADVSPPDWLRRFPDQPTLYASLGTVLSRPDILGDILESVRDQPVNVIMTIGRALQPEQFGPQPDNVHIEQHIPNDFTLFDYCNMVISHGGAGTTMAALAHGLPVLVIPLAGHLLQHAVRCKALGAGLYLMPPEWHSESVGGQNASVHQTMVSGQGSPLLSVHSLAEAIHVLLNDPTYRQAAQAIQAEIAALPGPEYAVTLLERLAEEHAPILS